MEIPYTPSINLIKFIVKVNVAYQMHVKYKTEKERKIFFLNNVTNLLNLLKNVNGHIKKAQQIPEDYI